MQTRTQHVFTLEPGDPLVVTVFSGASSGSVALHTYDVGDTFRIDFDTTHIPAVEELLAALIAKRDKAVA